MNDAPNGVARTWRFALLLWDLLLIGVLFAVCIRVCGLIYGAGVASGVVVVILFEAALGANRSRTHLELARRRRRF